MVYFIKLEDRKCGILMVILLVMFIKKTRVWVVVALFRLWIDLMRNLLSLIWYVRWNWNGIIKLDDIFNVGFIVTTIIYFKINNFFRYLECVTWLLHRNPSASILPNGTHFDPPSRKIRISYLWTLNSWMDLFYIESKIGQQAKTQTSDTLKTLSPFQLQQDANY